MASSSGAIHSSYDVFLSFRGEDTRNSFTDHLYEALVRAGFRTFRDNDAIDRGEDLKPEIERAIAVSRASIVVLSENYANSTWCLDELLLILDRRMNFDHLVLPVFYHVDPSDVRKQQKSFGDAFSIKVNAPVEGSQTSPKGMEKADRWKAALTVVANLTGMVLSGPETNFIADIVNTIAHKLDRKLVSTPPHLTGMDTRAKDIISWLKIKQSDAEVLAICGMGGSGKTTLAKYIYNTNSRNFKSSSFLEDIRKSCEQPHGLLELQKQLLTDILGDKKIKTFNVSEGTSKIEEALQTKRVLIVLDDIGKGDELAALLGTQKLNKESKIIITTRDLETHAWFESTSRRCRKYKLKLLNDDESLKLLSWHAFGSEIPMEGFKDLAVQVTQYCAGNPLALKVLGSSLFVSAGELQRGNNIESWRSTLKLLTKDTHMGIQGILRRSFDSLPYIHCKDLFLHIACFFIGVDKNFVVKILEPDYSASAGIITLFNKCLLTVSPSNKLMMHQLLQEMGRTIVREESKDPAKRSRVWCNEESYAIIRRGKGTETIEGLALDMQILKEQKTLKSSSLKTDSLTMMEKLKLLQLKYVQLTGSYEDFPEDLRWLCWHGFHLKAIPSDLFMGNMVALEMSYSNLEQFEPPMVLQSLKILNLKDSQKLVKIHKISRLPNLETLILWNCSSLAYVCETIGDLKNLTLLDMTGCENLWKVLLEVKYLHSLDGLIASDFGGKGPKQPFSLPHSIQRLLLNNCNLECKNYFHMVFSAQSSLQYLNLGNNPFDFLPNYNKLKNLRVLDLTFCARLQSLLCLPSTLEELYTYYCVSLEKITFQSARFRLREIGYGGCLNLSEIEGIFKLVQIGKLHEKDLGHMKWLKLYQNHEVGLIGDEITEGRSSLIQMLYEFGIMSTFLPEIQDPNMISQNISSSPFLSFSVPSSPKNRRLQGLDVTFLYRLSGEEEYLWPLFAKISNITKGLNWIYNPIVFGKPEFGKNAVWLSYWEIGNLLDIGDEVNVSIFVGNELEVSECGASLVYVDDEVEKETLQDNMEREEILGDLSAFQLSTGGYYLCRRDFFGSKEVGEPTPDWFKILVGDTIHYAEMQGWSKFGRSQQLKASFTEVETYSCITHGSELIHRSYPYLPLAMVGNDRRKGVKFEERTVKGSLVLKRHSGSIIEEELMGNVSLQLISALHVVSTAEGLRGKHGKEAKLGKWVTTVFTNANGDSIFGVNFDWEEEIGVPCAFLIRNRHYKEFYLKTLTLEDVPGCGRVHFICNSWVYPQEHYSKSYRLFFFNQTYLPSQTPEALRRYREEELEELRGNGTGKREEWDRIYDYDVYNDLSEPNKGPEHCFHTLGGSLDNPYPRRCRTGRPPLETDPNTESRIPLLESLNIYVPRDERFSHLKMADVQTYGIKLVSEAFLPGFETVFDKVSDKIVGTLEGILRHKSEVISEFLSFEDLLKLYEEGLMISRSSFLEIIKEKVPFDIFKELIPSDGPHLLKFPVPKLIEEDKFAWRTDEEFGREMLAGINPVVIRRLQEFPPTSKLDPTKFGNQNSRMTTYHVEDQLDGLYVSEALENNRLFILDHHDALMPFLRGINGTSTKTYATRTILILKNDGTLKPVAIELSLPHPHGDQAGVISTVHRPATQGAEGTIWQLAKAYANVNDSGYHQLICHWLHTHASIEPFVIATNRQLSVLHPIHKLLHPHFRDTININALARQTLINAGGLLEKTVFADKYSMELSCNMYKDWVFTEQALPTDLIKRGLAVEDPSSPYGIRLLIEDYPFAVDGLAVWSAIKAWVKDYCFFYYKNDEEIQNDSELQHWWQEVRTKGHADKKDELWWPEMQNRHELIESCTIIIWVASALHAAVNFGQYAYSGYLPNRPSISRRFMPEPGSADYDELESNPEKAFLKTVTPQLQSILAISLIEKLSMHSADEVFLGERDTPEWTADEEVLKSFAKFGANLREIEEKIVEMNKDKRLRNRFGPVQMPYTLLYPSSKAGLTGRGIPNSVSI